jgi:hypothetical protein
MNQIPKNVWRARLQRGLVLILAAGLTACANWSGNTLPPGTSQSDAIALMGPPTGRYPLPNGERLEYAKGPQGIETFMLDFDATRGLVRNEQVLDERHFALILPGMSLDDVRRTIGRPSHMQGMAFQRTLYSWRWNSMFCTWFVATVDSAGRVVDASQAPDPRCDKADFR